MPHDLPQPHLLVVDDEPKIREMLQDFLERRGCSVDTAASGEEALQAAEAHPPPAVLLDICMGGMDGLATLPRLKMRYPHATVIMITGLEEDGAREQAMASGADDYILKPFNLEYLETILLAKIPRVDA